MSNAQVSRLPPPPAIAVVIATHNRSNELANRSLRSVIRQTRAPDYLVVVDDSDRRYFADNCRIVTTAPLPTTRIHYLRNDRTHGASGAWNVGLDFLHRQVAIPPEAMFVAILDDDDEWDTGYLERCLEAVSHNRLDMVAADIVRIERLGERGVLNPAPDSLRADDFLVGNSHIQGSNLFVRLSTLLAAGTFDEALKSTTDRDLCIRLADLGCVRYQRIDESLVHHYAEPGRSRLTRRGSATKLDGLTAFWRKYSGRMTDRQQRAFSTRAERLFDWQPENASSGSREPIKPKHYVEEPADGSVALVVGIIADVRRLGRFAALVEDLTELGSDPRLAGLDVVLLENGRRGAGCEDILQVTAERLRGADIGCYVATVEDQSEHARRGLFGEPFERSEGMVSIADARTMLQTYTYLLAKQRTGAVVWILDGDMRLDPLVWNADSGIEQERLDVVGLLLRLRSERTDVDIAIGTVTDAPPVPFASCVRTQVVDLYHNLEWLSALDPDQELPNRTGDNMAVRARCDDYYYDLSRRETDHLETPFWYAPHERGATVREAFREMVERLPRILAGEQVFRSLVVDGTRDPLRAAKPSVHRGGNTLVLDVEALWEYPNVAPRIGGDHARRSDMVWSLLNRYAAQRGVLKVPFAVRQDRSDEDVRCLDLAKLCRDIQGYALYSGLEDVLLGQLEQQRTAGRAEPLDLRAVDPKRLNERVRKYLRERFAAFSLSFHRVLGLARSLHRYTDPTSAERFWWIRDPACVDVVRRLECFAAQLCDEYTLERLRRFREEVFEVDDREVHEFLAHVQDSVAARRRTEDPRTLDEGWALRERTRNAMYWVRSEYGLESLEVLGHGAEAVVMTDGRTVYKCLDYWKTRMPREQLEFLRSLVGRWSRAPGLYCLSEVRSRGSWVVLTYPYEPSEPYSGGHGEGLVQLVRTCRDVGIVCRNLHPDNLIVARGGVKLIDYGSDIRPYTDDGFLKMARRAWLTWRFPERPDLKLLMRRSLDEPDLEELDGFDRFMAAVEAPSKEAVLDAPMARWLGSGKGRRLLDYGCGKGKLAEQLATADWVVTAYDPDLGLQERWSRSSSGVRYLGAEAPSAMSDAGERFDVVLCFLVLCQVSDGELEVVLADLRRLVAEQGTVFVAICNPLFVCGTTQLQRREPPAGKTPEDTFCLEKLVFSTGVRVVDLHRPLEEYRARFQTAGFQIEEIEETSGVDLVSFEPNSDFMILHLRPIPIPIEVAKHATAAI